MENNLQKTPWDANVFGVETFEIPSPTEAVFKEIAQLPGHYTVKIAPLASKALLHKYGFYYCDTLIEPFCTPSRFIYHSHETIVITQQADLEELITVCHGAFSHGRFHRDFNLSQSLADLRYDNWLKDLYKSGQVYGLLQEKHLIGFIACSEHKLLLHAVKKEYQGKGLAKYGWSLVCKALFDAGHEELCSSISASNLAVVNLYARLGFNFRHPIDIYHRLVSV